MFSSLKDFLGSIFGTINKSDAELDLQNSINSLNAAYGSYQIASTIEEISGLHGKDTLGLIKTFYSVIDQSDLKLRLTRNNEFFSDIATLINNAITNAEVVREILSEIQGNEVVADAMEARNAIAFRSVPHYYFMSKYSTSLLNFVVATESELLNRVPVNIPKRSIDEIFNNMRVFTKLLTIYGEDPVVFKTKIMKLSRDVITRGEDARVDNYRNYTQEDIAVGLPSGFIGSPIYSLRRMFASWEAGRYHRAKVEKPLIESRLNEWQSLKEGGSTDPQVEKEINYLQTKLTSIERKLSEVEESVQ